MGGANDTTHLYELYYNSFSICSLMVLLTLRWKGEASSPDLAVDPVEKEIDIYLGEQMTADFLEKTWKGQVPVLLGPQSIKITDSLDITHFLGERYPQLLPAAHAGTIKALLDELHQVWFVSLSFRAEDRRGEGIVKMIHHLMAQPSSSAKYKAALQKKLQYLVDTYSADPHAPEIVAREEAKARAYLEKVSHIMAAQDPGRKTTWIFGDDVGATALDAHTVVFIGRLLDAGRSHLIGDDMLTFGKQHLQETDWIGITQGRPTLHTLWEKQEEAKMD